MTPKIYFPLKRISMSGHQITKDVYPRPWYLQYIIGHVRYSVDAQFTNVKVITRSGLSRLLDITFSNSNRAAVKLTSIDFLYKYSITIDSIDLHAVEIHMNNGNIIRCRFTDAAGGDTAANKFYEEARDAIAAAVP